MEPFAEVERLWSHRRANWQEDSYRTKVEVIEIFDIADIAELIDSFAQGTIVAAIGGVAWVAAATAANIEQVSPSQLGLSSHLMDSLPC